MRITPNVERSEPPRTIKMSDVLLRFESKTPQRRLAKLTAVKSKGLPTNVGRPW